MQKKNTLVQEDDKFDRQLKCAKTACNHVVTCMASPAQSDLNPD